MPDLSIPDLASPPDLTVLVDMTVIHDLTVLVDMTASPDMACVAQNCTRPPSNTCSLNMLVTYPNPGACDVNGACAYTPMMAACPNGCYSASCNNAGPSFPQDATADSTAGVTLDKEPNLNPSIGSAAANQAITVTSYVTPHNSLMGLTLYWTNDDFATRRRSR
jgi:hypothetical protein